MEGVAASLRRMTEFLPLLPCQAGAIALGRGKRFRRRRSGNFAVSAWGRERMPDATTLRKFRHRPVRHETGQDVNRE